MFRPVRQVAASGGGEVCRLRLHLVCCCGLESFAHKYVEAFPPRLIFYIPSQCGIAKPPIQNPVKNCDFFLKKNSGESLKIRRPALKTGICAT